MKRVTKWLHSLLYGSNAPLRQEPLIRPQVETADVLRPVLKKLAKKATARRIGVKKW